MRIANPKHSAGNPLPFSGRRLTAMAAIGLVAAMPFLAGCGTDSEQNIPEETTPIVGVESAEPNETPPSPAGDPSESDEESVASADDAKIDIQFKPWDEILASIRESGKPTVVDVWSLACEPCMKEFPGLVALHKTWGDSLHCVSVNVDFDGRRTKPPTDYLPQVRRFLESTDATITNYICETPSEDAFAAIDIVSIPAVLVFDADGKEIARFVDVGETRGFTYADTIAPAIADYFNAAETNQ
jgi:thiol-disulfide isomerase/thioredoxin